MTGQFRNALYLAPQLRTVVLCDTVGDYDPKRAECALLFCFGRKVRILLDPLFRGA